MPENPYFTNQRIPEILAECVEATPGELVELKRELRELMLVDPQPAFQQEGLLVRRRVRNTGKLLRR